MDNYPVIIDALVWILIPIMLAIFWRQHYQHMNALWSLKKFVENGSAHNTTILTSYIDRANSLDIQFLKLSGSINKRVKDLEIKIESLENPSTKNKIKKKLEKHSKRK